MVCCLGGITIKNRGVLCSSAGASSPFKRRKGGHNVDSVQPFRTAVAIAPPPGPPGCRPWDRGDLLQRLATYKSISWFGKPLVRTSHQKECIMKIASKFILFYELECVGSPPKKDSASIIYGKTLS